MSAVRYTALIFCTLLLISTIPSEAINEGSNWMHPGYDAGQTYFSPQQVINKQNVHLLQLKWAYKVPPTPAGIMARGGVQTPLLVIEGIIYMATGYNSIIAIDASDGSQLWSYQARISTPQEKPWITGGLGEHSISYHDGLIYMVASDCTIYAVNAKSGELALTIPDICKDIPGNKGRYFAETAPVFYKNLIIAAPAGGGSDARGFIAAYDKNARLIWRFYMVPPAVNGTKIYDNPGKDRGKVWGVADAEKGNIKPWPNDWGMTDLISGGVVWAKMLIDEETGILYATTANSSPRMKKSLLPGPNLFTNSVLAIKAETGELVWYYQVTPHALNDLDCGWGPTLTKASIRGESRKIVIPTCKDGLIFALDAITGKPVWEPVEVGIRFNSNANAGKGNDADMFAEQKAGIFCPGHLAGVDSHVTFAYNTIFAAVQNQCWEWIEGLVEFPAGVGRLVAGWYARQLPNAPTNSTIYAIDASTGRIKWEYFIPAVYHAAHPTVSGGVVYALDREGILHMLDADNGLVLRRLFFDGVGQNGVSFGADKNGEMFLLVVAGDPAIVSAFSLPRSEIERRAIEEKPPVEEVAEAVGFTLLLVLGASAIFIAVMVIAVRRFSRPKKLAS